MIAITIHILLVLFCVKLLWNIGVPYWLAFGKSMRPPTTNGVSLMPAIEVTLFAMLVGLAFYDGSLYLGMTPLRFAILCTALLVGSYLHLMLAGALTGWLLKRSRR
jgi:hypothetical protein